MKIKWPFVTRKRLERELREKKYQYQGNLHKQARKYKEREVELGKELREIAKNMLSVGVVYDDKGNRWRIVVELDAMRMSMCFERGNDNHMIEYLGDQIKYMAIREIKSCNIQRPEDFNLGRPRFIP
jgi:hypothetical protein